MNTSIFKSYDIRGIYPDEINEDAAYKIGRAFVEHLNVKQVAVGYDMRISTPSLLPHLYAGIADAGAEIIDLGMIGTEMMYFAVGEFKYESGIMLTASHNPSNYNGMKLVGKGAVPIGEDTGITDIKNLATQDYQRTNLPPKITKNDVAAAFKAKINSLVNLNAIKPMKIVVDAGNGMGGVLFNSVFSETALEIIPYNFSPDGNFPNHVPDPMKPENLKFLAEKVKEHKADLGIAFDGDADRCVFVDENGDSPMGYFIVAILAEAMLQKYPHANIVHENRLQWAIIDKVAENGGTSIACKAGHSHLKAKMRQVDAVFSGESSSHFFYKDIYFADSSILTAALIIDMMQKQSKKLSELLQHYRDNYFISGELNYEVDNAQKILDRFDAYYKSKGFEIDYIDGIAVDEERNWHLSLRKSNTEPLVRLNIEAKNAETVNEVKNEAEKLIKTE